MEAFNRWLRDVVPPIAVILVLDLAVTVAFFGVSEASVRIGTLRSVSTLPAKALELVLVGAGVGTLACVAERRLDVSLLTLAVAFVALIDVDHLPSVFGIAQPIRPTHTLAFLTVEVFVLWATFKSRRELIPLAIAAWFGHNAGDTGVFALFAPFSFAYSPLGLYVAPFAIASAAFALLTGYVSRRRQEPRSAHLATNAARMMT
jgi:hypothetical protein